jgi:hypothetical protein
MNTRKTRGWQWGHAFKAGNEASWPHKRADMRRLGERRKCLFGSVIHLALLHAFL